jgi:uncharacterized phage protein (TIGR01671 family)
VRAMPREIKFRAWNKIDKCMCPVHGYDFETQILWYGNTRRNNILGEPPKNFELMQYTGLHDKNGNEIYEGDIVKCTELTNDRLTEYISEVFWEQGSLLVHESASCDVEFCLFFEGIDKRPLTEIEVIGNIYENPELLISERMV